MKKKKNSAYFFKSKAVTRFPTGLKTPSSGVKTTLPCWYTVPHKFENCEINWEDQFLARFSSKE